MEQISAFMGTKKKVRRKVQINSISEDHNMQCLNVEDESREKVLEPPSPRNRNRSQSVYGSGISSQKTTSCVDKDPFLAKSGSTDLVDKIESLPKQYRRSNRRTGRLNSQLLEAIEDGNVLEVKRLLEAGASPNATCHVDFVSACHVAALSDDESLPLLLYHGADQHRRDRMGRTPLHVAAWAGHVRHLALFLKFPEKLQKKICEGEVSQDVEAALRDLRPNLMEEVNSRCELGEPSMRVPKEWRDGIDHNCNKIAERLPFFQPGWTALHAASSNARSACVRLLLAAGAEPCSRDVIGRTPLDVAGSAYYTQTQGHKPYAMSGLDSLAFKDVVSMLLATDCKSKTIRKRITLHTPLHTAVELASLDGVNLLLKAGASPVNWNRDGETPLHVCVRKRLKPHLQAIVFSDLQDAVSPTTMIIDVRDKDGCTVLHYSVLSDWLPGVRLALEAGANVTARSYDGETPLHSAAHFGRLDILNELLLAAKEMNTIDNLNKGGQTALFKAVKNGNIECTKMILKHGASITATLPDNRNVFHVAAAFGLCDMLKLLLDYDYTVTRVLVNFVTADDRKGYGPIHFAVEQNHIDCVKLLLSKNAYINLKARYGIYKGSTPLHIAARKNNTEIVKLILKNNISSIYIEDQLGWNALHTACYYASRDVIKLLLNIGSDISAFTGGQNKFRKTAIQLMMNNLSKPTEFVDEIFDSYINCNTKRPQDPNCEVTVDYSVLVPNKHMS